MTNDELPTVFITAAGNSRRFGNGTLKQLLLINGEPLIRRMVRQIREIVPDAQIHILTWHDALRFPDVTIIDTHKRPPELADTILLSEPYWSTYNVVLMGDVIYDKNTLAEILEYSENLNIWARYADINFKDHSERFSLTFPYDYRHQVRALLLRASGMYGQPDIDGSAGMRKICYATKPEWVVNLTTTRRFDSPFYSLIRPFRDFFCCHFIDYRSDWLPDPPVTLRYVNDYLTTDIDNWDEYYSVLRRGVPPP